MRPHKPVIGVPACRKLLDPHYFHAAGEKYLTALARAADCIPVIIPALGPAMELQVLIERLDGLLLTGSPSNVEPHRYGGPASEPGTEHDPERDETTLPLIPAVVEWGLPLFAICRGFQEMNVAFGGSLHQKVHEVGDYDDHREDSDLPLDEQYGPAHEVSLEDEGLLRDILGKDRITVNSLHSQGVERLGPRLVVEGRAPDGLIEAFRVADAPGFALGVQWHPEYKATDNPDSVALFRRFGEAARDYASRHRS